MATPRTGKPRGRPPGAPNKKRALVIADVPPQAWQEAKAQAAEMMPPSSDPIEVMARNLEWATSQSVFDAQAVFEAAKKAKPPDEKIMLAAYACLMKARALAQEFAKDLAPYLHPRLSATKPLPPDDPKPTTVEHDPHKDHLVEMAKRYGVLREPTEQAA